MDESSASEALAARTAELRRVTAEFEDYRRSAERERLGLRERTLAEVVGALLPVLDTIERTRVHEDIPAAFEAVAGTFDDGLTALGLQRLGREGAPYDPALHEPVGEAVGGAEPYGGAHPVCARIVRPGYRVGETVLRRALVELGPPPPSTRPSSA